MRIKYTVPTTSFFIDLSTLDYIPSHLAVNRNLLSTFGTVELVTIIRVGYLLTVQFSILVGSGKFGVSGLSVSIEGKCPHRWHITAVPLFVRGVY